MHLKFLQICVSEKYLHIQKVHVSQKKGSEIKWAKGEEKSVVSTEHGSVSYTEQSCGVKGEL